MKMFIRALLEKVQLVLLMTVASEYREVAHEYASFGNLNQTSFP